MGRKKRPRIEKPLTRWQRLWRRLNRPSYAGLGGSGAGDGRPDGGGNGGGGGGGNGGGG